MPSLVTQIWIIQAEDRMFLRLCRSLTFLPRPMLPCPEDRNVLSIFKGTGLDWSTLAYVI